MAWSVLLPNAMHNLLKVSWGIDWNLSLHHEKTTELLSDCRCIFISIQAMHMLGDTSARGLPCALQRSVPVPALLLLECLPYWTLPRKREGQRKEASGKPQCLRVSTTGLPDLDPSASGHLWIPEKGHGFHFKQMLDVVSINNSYFSRQVVWKWFEVYCLNVQTILTGPVFCSRLLWA